MAPQVQAQVNSECTAEEVGLGSEVSLEPAPRRHVPLGVPEDYEQADSRR